MPELDGFELADLIRQHPRFQEIAIIFISAVHISVDQLKAYQRGAMDYISVPPFPSYCGQRSAYLPICTAKRARWMHLIMSCAAFGSPDRYTG